MTRLGIVAVVLLITSVSSANTSSTLEIQSKRQQVIKEFTSLNTHLNKIAEEINTKTPRLLFLQGQIQAYNEILGISDTDTSTTRVK